MRISTVVGLLTCFLSSSAVLGNHKNVLFIISDDMRPDLNVYVSEGIRNSNVSTSFYTPNIDTLASQSLLMKNAFVQFPICGPSRASFLTGRYPDTIEAYRLHHDFRDKSPDIFTLPDVFLSEGYNVQGIGKIFHDDTLEVNHRRSWTDFTSINDPFNNHPESWKALTDAEEAADPLVDTKIKNAALSLLETLSVDALAGTQNFFLAVGFKKPHLPFVFPDDFLTHYDEDIELPPAGDRNTPTNYPPIAWRRCGTLCDADDIILDGVDCDDFYGSSMTDDTTKKLRRAYFASISYIDSLVGEVLTKLDDLGLTNDTIVVFMSDHGFHLGEHNAWCKSTNFDDSVRIPLMIKVPGQTDAGIVTDKLTEAIDVMPTVVEAAGLPPLPACPTDNPIREDKCAEGQSLMDLITDPNLSTWKTEVYSQVWRNGNNCPLCSPAAATKTMGYSVRSASYRYNHYVKFNTIKWQPQWKNDLADVEDQGKAELYDIVNDPYQTENLIDPNGAESAAIDALEDEYYAYLTTKFPKS